jgi:hypothetical protein
MSCEVSKFQLGIRDVWIGVNTKQKYCILCKADVAGSLNNKFIVGHLTTGVKHVFWFDVDNTGTAPTGFPVSVVLHEVDIASNATAGAVATALQTAINAVSGFTATISPDDGTHIEVELDAFGFAYGFRDADPIARPTSQTGFTFVKVRQGWVPTNLGPTDGDITLSKTMETLDITSPQTGAYVLDQLRRGQTATASFGLKDTSKASLVRVLSFDGDAYVSDDTDAQVLITQGSNKLFTSSLDSATVLSFRDPSGDESKDFHLMKAKLQLNELTFTAESELVLPVTATAYLDETAASKSIDFFNQGPLSKFIA